ncbi:dTDP-4-dehydrorhamnose 3,5-epimerase [Streptomyces sp. CoH17]|uniref:dTDP-4-dehydrorhamnose 3,5-epimerase family protein n=1 Tax=Streptomyces sp. CoH17 TaxID=2992806 RepID=UPI002D1E4854|nr:dTDP-4-dehydrorhamnose 3,5-epimerase [Streptomyces sp. CoH17]
MPATPGIASRRGIYSSSPGYASGPVGRLASMSRNPWSRSAVEAHTAPMQQAENVPLSVQPTTIQGLMVIRMKQISDERGTVREFYRESAFLGAGLPSLGPFTQINVMETRQGALRGLHGEDMHKLVAVAEGEAFGAYVDARTDSPTFGRTATVRLTKGTQVLVPRGVCNGFQSVSPGVTQYLYSFDQEWRPGMAGTSVHPLSAELAIPWPLPVDPSNRAAISAKDAGAPSSVAGPPTP